MKVYIKQMGFTFGDKLIAYDEFEKPIISVLKKAFSHKNKMFFWDKNNEELFYTEKTLGKSLSEYKIYQFGEQIAFLKRTKPVKYDFNINSIFGNFKVEGGFLSYDFKIYQGSTLIGTVGRNFVSIGDSCILDIVTSTNIEFLVTIVIIINQTFHKYQSR